MPRAIHNAYYLKYSSGLDPEMLKEEKTVSGKKRTYTCCIFLG